jgi:hypothetical protein
MLKKFAPAGLASLVAIILIAGVATPVHAAAVKQGAACTKSGAKAKSGKNNYVCQKNPAVASTKLVWITTDCAAAAKTYLSTKKDSDTFATEQSTALTKMKASVASWQNVVVLLDQKKAALETNLYPLWTDPTTKQMVKAQGITAAITQLTAKIAEITAKRDNAVTKSTAAGVSASDKLNWTKAASSYTTSITTYTRNRDNLAKVAPKIDSDRARAVSQIATMQTQLDASAAAQDTLTSQITDGAVQALKYRDIACKAGI